MSVSYIDSTFYSLFESHHGIIYKYTHIKKLYIHNHAILYRITIDYFLNTVWTLNKISIYNTQKNGTFDN